MVEQHGTDGNAPFRQSLSRLFQGDRQHGEVIENVFHGLCLRLSMLVFVLSRSSFRWKSKNDLRLLR